MAPTRTAERATGAGALLLVTLGTGVVVAYGCSRLGPVTVLAVVGVLGMLVLACRRPDLALALEVALVPAESLQVPLGPLGLLSPAKGAAIAVALGWGYRRLSGAPGGELRAQDLPALVLVASLLPGLATGAPAVVVVKLSALWTVFVVGALVVRELDQRQVVRLLCVMAATGGLLGLQGAVGYLAGGGAHLYGDSQVTGRAAAGVSDPNYYGALLLLLVGPAAGLVVAGTLRGWRRAALLLAIGAGATGVVLSLSRGALLGLGLALALVALSTSRSRTVTAVAVPTILLVTLAGLNPLLRSHAAEVIDQRLQSATLQTTSNERPLLWRTALDTAVEHPLVGIGALQFQSVAQTHGLTQRGKALSNAHNAYLNVLVEQGLLGLGALLAYLVVVGRALARLVRGSGVSRACGVGVGAALAAFCLQSLTVSPYQVEIIQALFLLLGGVALRLGAAGHALPAADGGYSAAGARRLPHRLGRAVGSPAAASGSAPTPPW